MTKFRDIVQNLPDNPGAEILRYGWRKPDVISLGQGEGCRPTPDFIVDAANNAMREGKTHYGPVLGQPALREEVSLYYKRILNIDLPSQQVFITGSGTTAMHLALTSILDKGDEVIAITPIWKNLLGAVELAEARATQVSLDYIENNGWSLDLDKVISACTPKTKAILVVTPSNPTGWVMSDNEIKALMDFARSRGIWIVSDEVYNRGVYGAKHAPSFLQHASDEDLLMTVNSFSKSWAMTGWRLGWLTGPKEAEAVIRDIALYDNMCPPTFTQYGGIAALRDGEDFIDEQLAQWSYNLDIITERFGENPKIHSYKPQSTFYSFFKVDGQDDSLSFAKQLVDDAGISLTPGCAFGAGVNPWMRMCFAVSTEKLVKALDRLEEVVS
jgi:aspartate/methionine/tyrosine aminotransferase